MKKFKHLFRLGSIFLGLFGIAAIFSSCFREKDCVCSYTYDGETYEIFTVTTKDKCENLEFTYEGESYDIKCK